jgi:hypothetical protein
MVAGGYALLLKHAPDAEAMGPQWVVGIPQDGEAHEGNAKDGRG